MTSCESIWRAHAEGKHQFFAWLGTISCRGIGRVTQLVCCVTNIQRQHFTLCVHCSFALEICLLVKNRWVIAFGCFLWTSSWWSIGGSVLSRDNSLLNSE